MKLVECCGLRGLQPLILRGRMWARRVLTWKALVLYYCAITSNIYLCTLHTSPSPAIYRSTLPTREPLSKAPTHAPEESLDGSSLRRLVAGLRMGIIGRRGALRPPYVIPTIRIDVQAGRQPPHSYYTSPLDITISLLKSHSLGIR
jgi:hypothetical protein